MRVNAQLIDAGAARICGPNNSTRPVPICCRRRTRSSRIWRTQSDFQLTEAEGARLKRTPAANRDAEDLALQCDAGQWKAGSSARRRMRHTRSANRRSPSIPTMSAP